MSFGSLNGIYLQPNDAITNGEVVRWNELGAVKYVSGAIDFTGTGLHTIATTNNQSQSFIPLLFGVIFTTITGYTSGPILDFGQNGGSFNDWAALDYHAISVSTGQVVTLPISLLVPQAPANTAFGINIGTGAVATTYSGQAWIIGFYN